MYKVHVRPIVWKDLKPLPQALKARLINQMTKLEKEPRPSGCKKLAGMESAWRVRIGDYRILYTIHDTERTVTVYRVRHRKDVYRAR